MDGRNGIGSENTFVKRFHASLWRARSGAESGTFENHGTRSSMNVEDRIKVALDGAGRTGANRRVVVAIITGNTIDWWGGSIDDWEPDETLLTSSVALDSYRQLVREFRAGRLPTGHAVMVYKNGSFASVMLGVWTQAAANRKLTEALNLVRVRNSFNWLKA
jgi:hypothetical protein